MLKMHKKVMLFMFCSIFTIFISGCDQVSAIKDYFRGSDEEKIESPVIKETTSMEKEKIMPADILASVGEWTITKDEFQERLSALKEVVPNFDATSLEAKKLVLDELVRQQMLVADAEKTGLANGKEIKSAVEEFRRTLIVREKISKLVGNVTVSEEEARVFFDENKEQLIQPLQFQVREIVVEDQGEATRILTALLEGEDFAETAKKYSISDSKDDGGDLGFVDTAPFEAMATVLIGLEVGEISNVVKAPTGEYYIIKLEEKKEGMQFEFDEIKKDIIQNQIILKQQQIILKKLEQLKSQIEIKVNYDFLK